MFIGDSEEGAYYYKLFDFIYYCEKKLFMSNWESLYINKKFLYSSEEEDDSGQFSPAVAFFVRLRVIPIRYIIRPCVRVDLIENSSKFHVLYGIFSFGAFYFVEPKWQKCSGQTRTME